MSDKSYYWLTALVWCSMIAFFLGASTCAHAKQGSSHIRIVACDGIRDYHECAFITISGDIVQGDGQQFTARANGIVKAAVVLSSLGGSMTEAIVIGELIHSKGWGTFVPDDAKCFSACANIWIASKTRGMGARALLLWHVAFRDDDPSNADGMGNVMMGVYLAHIDFDYDAALRLFGHDPLDVHTTYSDENGVQARKTLRWNGAEFAEKNGFQDPRKLEPRPPTAPGYREAPK
jgi:hypothetical protein